MACIGLAIVCFAIGKHQVSGESAAGAPQALRDFPPAEPSVSDGGSADEPVLRALDAVHEGGQLVALNLSDKPAPSDWWGRLARLFAVLAFVAFGFEVVRTVSSSAVEQVRLKWRRYAPWLRGRPRIALIGSDPRADWLAREITNFAAGSARPLVIQVRDRPLLERSALGPVLVTAEPVVDADVLVDLDLDVADQVVVMGSDDAVALARLNAVLSLPDNRPHGAPPRIVRVELSTPEVMEQVRSADWDRRSGTTAGRATDDIRIWNPDEIAARRVLRRSRLDWRSSAATPGGSSELVCIGFGAAGRIFASRFIRQAHHVDEAMCRITVIDAAGSAALARFRASYPSIDRVARIEHLQLDAFDPTVRKLVEERLRDPTRNLSISVAVGNVDQNLAVALGLSREIARVLGAGGPGQASTPMPVFVRQSGLSDVAGVFARFGGAAGHRRIELRPWGGLDDACRPSDILESEVDRRAERIHAAYLAKNPSRPEDELNPLSSRRPWRDLWSFFRDDNRNCADYFESRLRAAGLRVVSDADADPGIALGEMTASEIDVISRLEHRRWVVSRIMAGWHWGERADPELRTHNCICGWSELTQAQRDKDRLVSEALARDSRGVPIERLVRIGTGA